MTHPTFDDPPLESDRDGMIAYWQEQQRLSDKRLADEMNHYGAREVEIQEELERLKE